MRTRNVYGKRNEMGEDRRLALEMSRGGGEGIETYRVLDIIFFNFNLPACFGNVGKYRQHNWGKKSIWIFS
jgi:hypothetical protein